MISTIVTLQAGVLARIMTKGDLTGAEATKKLYDL